MVNRLDLFALSQTLGDSETWNHANLLESCHMAIGVDRGYKVNAYSIHQGAHSWVSVFVFVTEVLHQQQEEFPTQSFVTVVTSCVAELWLTC